MLSRYIERAARADCLLEVYVETGMLHANKNDLKLARECSKELGHTWQDLRFLLREMSKARKKVLMLSGTVGTVTAAEIKKHMKACRDRQYRLL